MKMIRLPHLISIKSENKTNLVYLLAYLNLFLQKHFPKYHNLVLEP